MISKNRVGYFVWTTHSHEGSIFLKVVKNILLKSEACHLVVPNIPLWGVMCHFKVSNNEATAKHSKPPSVSFKVQTYGEPRVDMNHSKVRVRLHLWFHSLNFAWTLHWQQLTLSWKGFKSWKWRLSQAVVSNWALSIIQRVVQHNPAFCTLMTHLEWHKSAKHSINRIFIFVLHHTYRHASGLHAGYGGQFQQFRFVISMIVLHTCVL